MLQKRKNINKTKIIDKIKEFKKLNVDYLLKNNDYLKHYSTKELESIIFKDTNDSQLLLKLQKDTIEQVYNSLKMYKEIYNDLRYDISKEKVKKHIMSLDIENLLDYNISSLKFLTNNDIGDILDFNFIDKYLGISKLISNENKSIIVFMPKSENRFFLNKLNESSPTDVIYLDDESDKNIMNFWRNDKSSENIIVPSDIFFAKTIPLKDCEIIIDESKIGGYVTKSRVHIFNDYESIVNSSIANPDKEFPVGIITHKLGDLNSYIFVVIKIKHEFSYAMVCTDMGTISLSREMKDKLYENINYDQIGNTFISILSSWYGIQISLLHPTVKEIFNKPKATTEKIVQKNNKIKEKIKSTPRKVKNIRYHRITNNDFNNFLHSNTSYNRKTMVWYVVGHFRKYKNGKTVFIKPYWKGPMRMIKESTNPREREIVINEDIN